MTKRGGSSNTSSADPPGAPAPSRPLEPVVLSERDTAELALISPAPRPTADDGAQSVSALVAHQAFKSLGGNQAFARTALLGHVVGQCLAGETEPSPVASDGRLLLNVAAPSTAVLCGVQGSGKSHALGVLLENALSPHRALALPGTEALAGLTCVMHSR